MTSLHLPELDYFMDSFYFALLKGLYFELEVAQIWCPTENTSSDIWRKRRTNLPHIFFIGWVVFWCDNMLYLPWIIVVCIVNLLLVHSSGCVLQSTLRNHAFGLHIHTVAQTLWIKVAHNTTYSSRTVAWSRPYPEGGLVTPLEREGE